MADDPSEIGPLEGIRVLDLTAYLAGPYCTRMLADLGAEVLKIEPPAGDFLRHAPPKEQGRSRYFGHVNCGKKSVVLDLKSGTGQQAFFDLAATSDVLVENFRPGVMARLGFGYDAIKAAKADIIYCSISGYGQSGPDAQRSAFAPIIHAACGFDMAQFDFMQGTVDRPARNRNPTADVLAATHAFGAISAALLHRQKTGVGQYIDLALIDCMHNMMASEVQIAQSDGDKRPVIFSPIRAADGFLMVAPVSPANFEALANAIGRPELTSDPRFAVADDRIQNFDRLMAEAEAWSLGRSAAECEEIILGAGCPCTRYFAVGDSVAHRSESRPGSSVEFNDAGGRYYVTNTPFTFSDAKVCAKPRVPELGEHTDEILKELAK